MNRVCVLLGSNIEKEHNLPEAVRLLAAAADVTGVSSVYETLPKGLAGSPNFFNAAVCLSTVKTAAQLKSGLLTDIERVLGRERSADRNAPRTIDLDIALVNSECFSYPGPDGRLRHVPDPDLLRFAHAALPIAELDPLFVHPETGETMQSIADRLASAANSAEPAVWKRPDMDLKGFLKGTSAAA